MTYKVLATVNHKSLDKKNIKQFKSGALAVAVEKASNGNDFVKQIKSTSHLDLHSFHGNLRGSH